MVTVLIDKNGLISFVGYSGNGQRLSLYFFLNLFCDNILEFDTEIFLSSGKLELFSWLKFLFELKHGVVVFLEDLLIELPIICHQYVVDFKIVLFEFVIAFLQLVERDFLLLIKDREIF
jgi:hypothetical protein